MARLNIKIGKVNHRKVMNDVEKRTGRALDGIDQPTIQFMVAGIKSGKARWPVDTGRSRGGFYAAQNGISNRVPVYPKLLENEPSLRGNRNKHYHKIRDYVLENIADAGVKVVDKNLGRAFVGRF